MNPCRRCWRLRLVHVLGSDSSVETDEIVSVFVSFFIAIVTRAPIVLVLFARAVTVSSVPVIITLS